MKKESLEWHKNDISDELKELREESGILSRWSEYSDVAYTYTRARWTGYKIVRPISFAHFVIGLIYMFPKYTLRWLFFRRAGKKLGVKIHEVRNPKKTQKLEDMAIRYGVDSREFTQVCNQQLKYWPLLK